MKPRGWRLYASEVRKVPPFEGLEDGVFELYWAEFNPDDIVPPNLKALKLNGEKYVRKTIWS